MQKKQTINKCIIALFLVITLLEEVKGLRGDVTFYYEWNGGYGSCGLERSRYDKFYVAALSRKYMNLPPGMTNPNNHPMCGESHCLQIRGARGTVVVKVSDTCEGCKNDDVDIADSVFPLLDDPNRGRVSMEWSFVDCRTNPPGRK